MEEKFKAEDVVEIMTDIGEMLLKCGGEVYRVEDTIKRIGTAYGAESVDVFAIMSMLIVTVSFAETDPITQMRRVENYSTDLRQLARLNSLSRKICKEILSIEEVHGELMKIEAGKAVSLPFQMLGGVLTTGALTIFFGGNIIDGCAGALISILMTLIMAFSRKKRLNGIMQILATSFVGGIAALCLSRFALVDNVNSIMIGDIMILVPGVGFTNALRDLMTGDLMTGVLKMTEVIITVVAIAGGYAFAIMLLGGGVVA